MKQREEREEVERKRAADAQAEQDRQRAITEQKTAERNKRGRYRRHHMCFLLLWNRNWSLSAPHRLEALIHDQCRIELWLE